MWKGHDEIQNIRSEISTRDLYKAFKYIRGLESIDLAKYAPDLESFKLEELDWSSCFDETLWDRALIFDQHLLRLNLRAYGVEGKNNVVRWIHYSNTVVRGISVLMAFAQVTWKHGMAPGGKYLKDMTERVLRMQGLTVTATRTVRSPLKRLFPYIPILGDEDQVKELMDFYHAEAVDVVDVVDVASAPEETFDLSNIRTSFVCGDTQVFADMTTVTMFENKSFVIADQDHTRDVCVRAGFEFFATKSTRIMLKYGEYDLTVFETGLVMIFGVLEKEDLIGDLTGDHLRGLQTAIRNLANQIEKTCIDSGRMMGALVEFGKQREIWDTRTEYFKKKERKCL
ncbi:hypothetical protein TrLO_g12069 [Triparma laevis f. longispina]|uniref:Uncharacterized protein n=1 Tax=Triparma laevis f. longispina TaxID=1714387 RepID=A0A9W7ALD4_9STRA|nr:hypothetical protein TrLO_g12069 [Triparma laevis f. longispina]